jgi:hypothetical protein
MGQEESQRHSFPCRKCGEKIVVRMDVDYQAISTRVTCEENSELCLEDTKSPIVNLDANFLIPEEDQGRDGVFFRMNKVRQNVQVAQDNGLLIDAGRLLPEQLSKRPFRRPDFADEWRSVRKAWALTRKGRAELAADVIRNVSAEYYPIGVVSNLTDWLWNFTNVVVGRDYNVKLNEAMKAIGTPTPKNLAAGYRSWNALKLVPDRSDRYLDIFGQFFAAYEEFGQVTFSVMVQKEATSGHLATSVNFEKTKMFYGNAFEVFGSVVDLLAVLNNLMQGREFDKFQQLTYSEYQKLDKSSKLGPFAMNAKFMALCEEYDNGLRNASHHGRLAFDHDKQTISYKGGKGGLGEIVTLSYASYLLKCVKLFYQIVGLFQIELVFMNSLKLKSPILQNI